MNENFDDISFEEIKDKFNTSLKNIEKVKESIQTNQKQAHDLCNIIAKDRKNLAKLEQEHQILEQIYQSKEKEYFQDHFGGNSFQKIFNQAVPFLKKIRDKTAELVANADTSDTEKSWFNGQYEKYVRLSKEKGQQVKSKQEVKKILDKIQDIKSGLTDLNLYEIINKVESEASSIKEAASKVLENISLSKKIDTLIKDVKSAPDSQLDLHSYDDLKEKIMNPEILTKKEALCQWIFVDFINKNISLHEEHISSKYATYASFIKKKYPKEYKNLTYSSKGGAFKTAVRKSLPTFEHKNV